MNMNYNEFVKYMFSLGFDWLDIEYYWRHQDELKALLNRPLTDEEKEQQKRVEILNNI